MRRFRRIIIGAVAALATLAAMSTASALAQTSHSAAASRPTAASVGSSQVRLTNSARPDIPRSPRNCPKGFFCSYNDSGSPATPCFYSYAAYYNWSSSCANQDRAVYNYVPNTWKTRMYYYPSGWGNSSAWMCIDGGDYLDNLSGYTFDQGDYGRGQTVYDNAASDTVVQGSCSPNE
jgi:hypothetical protein